ncbi:RcnB family protein [uncultured Sphingomonas sp.]|uniref:RcnB family protein n=1 Tax=uncultured Sphingomonas sp. TaxID=158754 RepID=UPI0035CA44FC
MRTVMIATAVLALVTADGAVAQRSAKQQRVAHAAAGRTAALPDTYRRPTRGWALPVYWQAQRFAVADWRALGLREPLPGYRWMRYHDDAVLVDRNYSIFDVATGAAGTGGDPFYANDDRVYAGPGERRVLGAPYARPRMVPQSEPMYDADGEPPVAPERMPPLPVDYADDEWVSPDGRTVVTSRRDDRPWGGSVTTITIGNAATTTTTTTTESY